MKNKDSARWFLVGAVGILLLGFTTDQIMNNVYDSSNTALRAVVVSGGGTPVPVGTAYATVENEATPLTQRNTLNFIGGPVDCVDNSGATRTDCTITAATPQPTATPGTGGSSPVSITLVNASSTGTTLNKLAKVNADGTAVIVATTDTTGAVGPVTSGAGTTGSATIQIIGTASCVFDGATTAGDYITISSGTAGDCHDAGSTFPAGSSVLGIVTSTNGGAGTYSALFETPDIMNVSNAKGGPPGKYSQVEDEATPRAIEPIVNMIGTYVSCVDNSGATRTDCTFITPTPITQNTPLPTATPELPITNLTYSGKLNVTGSTSISASATPAANDRNIYCTSGSSAITYTMPAATGTGRVIDVWKIDSAGSGTCVLGRAGSDTLNGATTLTLQASSIGHEVCIDKATNVWLCAGAGT